MLKHRLFGPEDATGGGGGGSDSQTADSTAGGAGTPETSIDDTIRNTWREIHARGELLDDGEGGDEPATPANPRTRGADGRFASSKPATPSAATLAQAKPAGAGEQQPGEEGAPAPAATPKPHDAYPSSWKPDHQEAWKTVPEAVRAEIHRREQNFLDGIKEYRQPAAFGRAVGQHMLPHVELMRRMGTNPVEVTRDLFDAWSTLASGSQEQKAARILQVCQQFGIDIASLATARHRDGSSPATPPATDTAVTQRIARLEQQREADAQEQARLDAEEADRELAAFAADPAHSELYPLVKGLMGALLASGSARTLKDAFDMATWGNAEARAKLLAKQDQERRQRELEEAANARKAAATNVRPRGTPQQSTKPGTMEDTIRSTAKRLGLS